MSKDYIPRNDSELIEFANNFITKIDGSEAGYGLIAADTTALKALRTTFSAAYDACLAAQNAVRSAREQKDSARGTFVGRLRSLAQQVQTTPNVTDTQRSELGLTVRQEAGDGGETGAPASRPVVEIGTAEPLRHLIEFYDNELDGRGKPPGIRGAEIWVKIGGEATMNEEDYRYLATDTASPYLAVHKPENTGKQAHYLLRWVNNKGEFGAWSNAATATVTG